MASREARFRQAAIAYLVYGVLYMAGAIYLASQGIGTRGMRVGGGIGWFIVGALLTVLVPVLLYRPWELHFFLRDSARRVCFFTREVFGVILTLLVAFRAFGVGRVALNPTIPTVPLPGGGEISMALGAWVFFLITLGTMVMLARASFHRE